jgi:hypothetical protein
LVYSLILRLVMDLGGHSVQILRLPAVIFGVGAVLAVYVLGTTVAGRPTGLVAALLTAISSYAVGYSQEVRFYSFFLLAGALALHSLALLVRDGPSARRIAWFAGANLLCLAAQLLGIVVLGAEIVSLVLLTAAPGRAGRRALGLCAVAILGLALLSIHQVRLWGFQLVARYSHAAVTYTQPHGLHVTNLVKIGWTFFVFTFGERVYPLWLWLTGPGAILIAVIAGHGLWSLRHNRLAIGVLLPQLILGPVVLYLVFDAITAAGLQGASPRYLMPLLAPFLVVIAAGVTAWRARWAVILSLALVLALNVGTLAAYWDNIWTYNGYMPDWPRVAALVSRYATPGTLLLLDGRSVDPAAYYLSGIERDRHLRVAALAPASVASVGAAPRIIAIADTDRAPDQATMNVALDALQTHYTAVDGFVRFPLFAYVLDRGHTAPGGDTDPSSGWRPVPLPVELLGLPLADLALPITIDVPSGVPAAVSRGAFGPSPAPQLSTRTLTLPVGGANKNVLLATSLEDDAGVHDGDPVASLTLAGKTGSQTIILRKGIEVDDWQRVGSDAPPPGASYSRGYSWTKLVSLVGQRAYPEAYHQFRAGIAVTVLPLSGGPFTTATVHYLAATGTLHIWAALVR